jgi:hypothetical protein
MPRGFPRAAPQKSLVTSLPRTFVRGCERAKDASEHDDETLLCYYDFRMSARIVISGLLAVLAGTDAIASTVSEQCAVCKSCNARICSDLG